MRSEGGALLDEGRLEEAVAIHDGCFRLVNWLASAVGSGFVPHGHAHRYLADADTAAEWIAQHFANIPPPCRPGDREGEALRRFANYFASYLKTSFVLHESGLRPVRGCPCCDGVSFRELGHLQARTPDAKAKNRAERMKQTCVIEVGLATGARLSDAHVQAILDDERRSTDAALVAYGIELLRRCDGGGSGPAALALWRQFAWRRLGHGWRRRRDFELTSRLMLDAEKRLLEAVQSC